LSLVGVITVIVAVIRYHYDDDHSGPRYIQVDYGDCHGGYGCDHGNHGDYYAAHGGDDGIVMMAVIIVIMVKVMMIMITVMVIMISFIVTMVLVLVITAIVITIMVVAMVIMMIMVIITIITVMDFVAIVFVIMIYVIATVVIMGNHLREITTGDSPLRGAPRRKGGRMGSGSPTECSVPDSRSFQVCTRIAEHSRTHNSMNAEHS
jgi:hypothetical protein